MSVVKRLLEARLRARIASVVDGGRVRAETKWVAYSASLDAWKPTEGYQFGRLGKCALASGKERPYQSDHLHIQRQCPLLVLHYH